jgi:uncharacterized protein YecT (DUF1311 family)
MSILLSGKMLAVLRRPDKTPRDLYDLFWLLSRGVEENQKYCRLLDGEEFADQKHLYQSLLESVEAYAEERIATELCAMLTRSQRAWVREHLKERTKELIALRLSALSQA